HAQGPAGGGLHPGHDLHERRLAGAVLAQQGVHLAGVEVEVDPLQRLEGAEALGDVPHLQQGRGRRARRRGVAHGAPSRSSRSTSAARGSDGWAPGRVVGSAPAAQAERTTSAMAPAAVPVAAPAEGRVAAGASAVGAAAAAAAAPAASRTAKAPVKASPAAVVSTAFTANAGTRPATTSSPRRSAHTAP